MKTKVFGLGILMIYSIFMFSCKDDIEDVINCLGESTSFSFDHSLSPSDAMTAVLEVEYFGDFNLDNSITWTFGDGNSQTSNGTSISHKYTESGTYDAVAKVTIRNGDAYCSYDLSETITIP